MNGNEKNYHEISWKALFVPIFKNNKIKNSTVVHLSNEEVELSTLGWCWGCWCCACVAVLLLCVARIQASRSVLCDHPRGKGNKQSGILQQGSPSHYLTTITNHHLTVSFQSPIIVNDRNHSINQPITHTLTRVTTLPPSASASEDVLDARSDCGGERGVRGGRLPLGTRTPRSRSRRSTGTLRSSSSPCNMAHAIVTLSIHGLASLSISVYMKYSLVSLFHLDSSSTVPCIISSTKINSNSQAGLNYLL